jgi:hypothetical protein
MASAGWAAIGAVGGALVGATAGGFVDLATRWATDRRLARTGARLVAADLRRADSYFKSIVEAGKWTETNRPHTSTWPEYRSVLVGRLDRQDFEVVTITMIAIEDMARLHERPEIKFGEVVKLPAETVEKISGLRGQLAQAYNALAGIGDLNPVGDRIVSGPDLVSAIDAEATAETGNSTT